VETDADYQCVEEKNRKVAQERINTSRAGGEVSSWGWWLVNTGRWAQRREQGPARDRDQCYTTKNSIESLKHHSLDTNMTGPHVLNIHTITLISDKDAGIQN